MLKILTYGDKLLTRKSEEVKEVNHDIKELIEDMFETMYLANGIGLAAVQVGLLIRVITMDVPKFGKYAMINPVIKDKSIETDMYEEGCLSLPGIANDVERSKKITVEYIDENGKHKKLKAIGLLATCIQHEYDHLEGILFVDRLSPDIKLNKIKEYKNLHIV